MYEYEYEDGCIYKCVYKYDTCTSAFTIAYTSTCTSACTSTSRGVRTSSCTCICTYVYVYEYVYSINTSTRTCPMSCTSTSTCKHFTKTYSQSFISERRLAKRIAYVRFRFSTAHAVFFSSIVTRCFHHVFINSVCKVDFSEKISFQPSFHFVYDLGFWSVTERHMVHSINHKIVGNCVESTKEKL